LLKCLSENPLKEKSFLYAFTFCGGNFLLFTPALVGGFFAKSTNCAVRDIFRRIKSDIKQKIHSLAYRIKAAHDKKIWRNLLHDNRAGSSGFERLAAKLSHRRLPTSPLINRLGKQDSFS
jgi:hypothetical protein